MHVSSITQLSDPPPFSFSLLRAMRGICRNCSISAAADRTQGLRQRYKNHIESANEPAAED
jgi:hypothetical protein